MSEICFNSQIQDPDPIYFMIQTHARVYRLYRNNNKTADNKNMYAKCAIYMFVFISNVQTKNKTPITFTDIRLG